MALRGSNQSKGAGMTKLILVSAMLLSACTDMKMERFALRTVDGKEIILVCPTKIVGAGMQLPPDRCYTERQKEQK